jgi:hyperosmotically inducible protein
MKNVLPILILTAALAGCSQPVVVANVESDTRTALDQAGLKDVAIKVDNGNVKLTGEVASEAQKSEAATIAKGKAGSLTVINEISVRPPGMENQAAKSANAADDAIHSNIKLALVQARLDKDIDIDVKEGVVTLKGTAPSEATRTLIVKTATAVTNVKQVVNEIKIKG